MLLAVDDVESDLGFYHGPEVIPRTFPMPWATKFDPHHLQSFTVILRSLRPEVEILFRVIMSVHSLPLQVNVDKLYFLVKLVPFLL